jgi:hypothetical protein
MKKYFQPKLNENGLFNRFDTAELYLSLVNSLQKLHPGFWENDNVEFDIVGVWRID